MPNEILATIVDPAGMAVEVMTGSGHQLRLDAAGDEGKHGGAGPKEALLAALAGCTAMDVATILRKKRQLPTGYQIAVSGDSAAEHPRVFVHISVEHRVSGAVEPEALRRSIELSATRYCPVSAMLSASVTIEHRYRLQRDGEPPRSELVVTTGPR